MNGARRRRSVMYLRAAWVFLEYACAMIERAEEMRRRAHAIDLKAYEQARDEVVAETRARMAELRIELAIREKLDERDATEPTDEYGIRW